MRVHEVALASLRRHLSAWIAHEPARGSERTPRRCTICALRVDGSMRRSPCFAPFLPVSWLRMRTRLKVLVRTFGSVRDIDIERAALAQFEEGHRRSIAARLYL